jgi:hypothetical protein
LKEIQQPPWSGRLGEGGNVNAEIVVCSGSAAGVSIGYAARPGPAVAQAEFQPFTVGETVRLTVGGFPSGVTTIACKVVVVSDDFIHCGGDGQRRPRASNRR